MSIKAVTLTSKNQITLPAALVRRAGFRQGERFSTRLEGGAIILEPQQDIGQTVQEVQSVLRPLVKRPLSDAELQEALHGWTEDEE